MNTALAILAHATRMLVFDPATTLRVLAPALVLVMACSVGISLFAADTVAMLGAEPETIALPNGGSLALFFLLGLVALLAYALMAILWHRHVLLNGAERREDLQPSASIYVGYVWQAIIVAFVQLLAAIPVTLAMGALGGVFSQSASGLPNTLIGIGGGLIFIWFALRFSVVLPAAALNQPLRVSESWSLTKPISGPLWGLALLLTGLNLLLSTLSAVILADSGVVAVAAQTLVFVIEGLIFISVLTTLYGHLVEGRSLGQ